MIAALRTLRDVRLARLILPILFCTLLCSAVTPLSVHAQADAANETLSVTGQRMDISTGVPADETLTVTGQRMDISTGVPTDETLTVTGQKKDLSADTSNPQIAPAAANKPADFGNNRDDVLAWIMVQIMKLFAWLLGIAALTLDNAMYYTVVHMGDYVNSLSAVGVAWRILRDIGNIFLIFGFIALGISVILDVDWYGGGTKMLPKLLIAAVFLNFSLFAAEAVVDVGNLFATEFYTQINNGQAASAPDIASISNIANEPISYTILNQLGFQTIYGDTINSTGNAPPLSSSNIFVIGFMSVLLFIIAAFVFFSLAFILIARFVVLILLIIVAPIGFAGMAIPKLDKYANQWWGMLFQQTLTAPVMLLMLYVALAVITDSSFLTGFTGSGKTGGAASTAMAGAWTTWAGDPTKIGSLGAILLSFIVAMGLLYAVVLLSKQLGAMGADFVTKNVTRAGIMAGALATYMPRRGARGATYLGGKGLEWARNTKSGSWIARRALPLVTLGAVGNIDIKKAAEGMQNAKYGTRYSEKELVDFEKKDKPLRESEQRKRQASRDISDGISDAKNAKNDTERAAANDKISRALNTLSDKEIAELKDVKTGVNELVTNLSPQQFESLMKSDALSESQKGSIKTERYRDLGTAIKAVADGGDKDQLFKVLSGFSKGELESMPAQMLDSREVLENLSDKQRETLTDGKERTASEKEKIRNNSKSGMLQAKFDTPTRGAGAAAAVRDLPRLSPPQVAKLPTRIITNATIAAGFTPAQLNAIQKEDKLNAYEKNLVKDAILDAGSEAAKDHVKKDLNAWYWS